MNEFEDQHRPADIAFQEEENDGDDHEHEVRDVLPGRPKSEPKKKSNVLLIGGGIFIIFVVCAITFVVLKKLTQRDQMTEEPVSQETSQVPVQPQIQPQIQPVQPPAQLASAPVAVLTPQAGASAAQAATPPQSQPQAAAPQPATAPPTAPPAQTAPQSQPSEAAAPQQNTAEVKATGAVTKVASTDSSAGELTTLRAEVKALRLELKRLKSPHPVAMSSAPSHPKVAVKHKPSAMAKSQAEPSNGGDVSSTFAQKLPGTSTYGGRYTITGMVGNRVFIVKKMPDGSDIEMTASPGETMDGRRVVKVDAESRCVKFDSGEPLCRN